MKLNPIPSITALSTLLLLGACSAPPPPPPTINPPGDLVLMPETADEQTPDAVSESPAPEVVEENTQEQVEEVVAPVSPIPEGITLLLGGKAMSWDELKNSIEPDREQTVTVQSSEETPYSDVAGILVKLHELGFLVEFTTEAR